MQLFLDLDGTIVDPSYRYYKLYLDLAKTIGFKPLELDHYWRLKREFISETDILKLTTHDNNKIATYLAEREIHIEDPAYLNLDRIDKLTHNWLKEVSKSHPLYLVTMRKHRDFLMAQLAQLKIVPYFKKILSRDNNTGHWSVKKDLVDSCLQTPVDGWLIGDTETDIQVGKALGLNTAAVTSGLRTESYLLSLSPALLIDRLTDFSLEPKTKVEA